MFVTMQYILIEVFKQTNIYNQLIEYVDWAIMMKNILILQNKIPTTLKNIDLTVNHSLQRKIDDMGRFLNDPDLTQMSVRSLKV